MQKKYLKICMPYFLILRFKENEKRFQCRFRIYKTDKHDAYLLIIFELLRMFIKEIKRRFSDTKELASTFVIKCLTNYYKISKFNLIPPFSSKFNLLSRLH